MKVAIIASGHGKYKAPFFDAEWECWGVNSSWADHSKAEKKFARWFELHRRKYLEWESRSSDAFQATWMRQLRTLPVYVQDVTEWPEMTTVKAFPFADLDALLPGRARYHACSIDWMLAYAIQLGAEEVRLFGVEQHHTAEPVSSRACLEFWAGFAEGRGIKVSSADGSTFKLATLTFHDTPYAFDPTWLPRQDDSGHFSTLAREKTRLERVVAGTQEADVD